MTAPRDLPEQGSLMVYAVRVQGPGGSWRDFDTYPTMREAQRACRGFRTVGARACVFPTTPQERREGQS
jgi:hypothetical protein